MSTMEDVKYTPQDLREVGQKVKEKWEKQLPIVRECAYLVGSKETGMMVLEPVVHNLSVIASEQIYKLLDPVFFIFMDFDLRGKSEELKKVIRTNRDVITKLRRTEKEAAKNQAAEGTEEEYMQHVECDMSGFYKTINYLLIMGCSMTDRQIHYLEQSVVICQDICRWSIRRGEQALATAEKMLQA